MSEKQYEGIQVNFIDADPLADLTEAEVAKAARVVDLAKQYPYGEKPIDGPYDLIATSVLEELTDRRGVGHELKQYDTETAMNIRQACTDVVRVAMADIELNK